MIIRRPLFPGRHYLDQLDLILDVLGSPTVEDLDHVTNRNARNWVENLPPKTKQSWSDLCQGADATCCDFIDRLLTFGPHNRVTVEQALAHTYLSQYYDPNDEPTFPHPLAFESGIDDMSKEDLKKMIFQEIKDFTPPPPQTSMQTEAMDQQ